MCICVHVVVGSTKVQTPIMKNMQTMCDWRHHVTIFSSCCQFFGEMTQSYLAVLAVTPPPTPPPLPLSRNVRNPRHV